MSVPTIRRARVWPFGRWRLDAVRQYRWGRLGPARLSGTSFALSANYLAGTGYVSRSAVVALCPATEDTARRDTCSAIRWIFSASSAVLLAETAKISHVEPYRLSIARSDERRASARSAVAAKMSSWDVSCMRGSIMRSTVTPAAPGPASLASGNWMGIRRREICRRNPGIRRWMRPGLRTQYNRSRAKTGDSGWLQTIKSL